MKATRDSILVFHKIKGVWHSQFKTRTGAIRSAKKQYPFMTPGTPFRWGTGWNIYVHKVK